MVEVGSPSVTLLLPFKIVVLLRFQGPLFQGKTCIRFSWPFCARQLLTHTVVVAPAPSVAAHQAEWHLPPGMFYSRYLQFSGSGMLHLVRPSVLLMMRQEVVADIQSVIDHIAL